MPRKKKSLSAAETADVLDRIAERVARADTTGVDQLKDVTLVEHSLMDLKQTAGLRLLLRISQQHFLAGRPVEELRYDKLKRIAKTLPPLDPAADAEALRALATQIRQQALG